MISWCEARCSIQLSYGREDTCEGAVDRSASELVHPSFALNFFGRRWAWIASSADARGSFDELPGRLNTTGIDVIAGRLAAHALTW